MFYKIVKRILDLIIAIILWIPFSPLMLLILIAIKISDGGEVFVSTPMRNGIKGDHFFMYKFRTMIPNAHSIVINNPKKKNKLLSNHKLENDNRVTKIGRILRNTDLDEVPQLINVILGNMSIVGPRPFYDEEIQYHLEKYPEDIQYLKNIFTVKPGITGPWQVSGRNSIPFRSRLQIESEYALNPNIFKDIYYFLKTPFVVITRKGVKGKNV